MGRRDDYREKINRHIDAGTCHVCGLPVVDGQARNGLSGAHWACEEAGEANFEKALNKLTGMIEDLEQIHTRKPWRKK